MYPCTQEHKNRLLQAAGDNSVIFTQELSQREAEEVLQSAHMIIGEPDMELIRHNPNLELLQMTWAGTDKYTQGQEFPRQVTLCNMSGAFGTVIAEYVIGGILALYRRFPTYWKQQQERIWRDAGSEEIISGKNVLYLGTGDIGTSVAKRLKAFGTYNIGVRREIGQCPACFEEMHDFSELDTLLGGADIVVCSLPDKAQTRGMINRERLLAMQSDALLINVGRGTLIDLQTLTQVLQTGHLRGVILDVTNPEPLPADHPLWGMERVLMTPHVAGKGIGHSADTQNRIVAICCENIRRYLHGEELLNQISRTEFES